MTTALWSPSYYQRDDYEMKKRKFLTLGGLIAIARKQVGRMSVEDIKRYGKHFSELGLKEKVQEVARLAGEQILLPVLRLWYVFRADSTPAVRKAYIAGALGYFILPVDLIPDALGLLGFSDDLGVVLMITKWVSELITPEIEAQAQATYRKLTPCLHSADTHLVTHE